MFTSRDEARHVQGPTQDPSHRTAPRAGRLRVDVCAPGRLHLGFLDPGASLGRRYGSIGVVIDDFTTWVVLERAREDRIDAGEHRDEEARLRRHLETLRQLSGCTDPLHVRLAAALPAHAGFGSGTQLALALGRGFSELFGLAWSTADVARRLGRGARSGVGVAGFDQGGFIVDGGPAGPDSPAPVLARLDVPAAWRVLVVQDDGAHGLHGSAELQALQQLPAFTRPRAADLCHQVLMKMLPSLAEARFEPFAQAVTDVQRSIGDYFAPAQSGRMYTSPAVARLMQWITASGVPAGVGQSSWGPTAFAFVAGTAEGHRLLEQARAAGVLESRLHCRLVAARNRGATIESRSLPPA